MSDWEKELTDEERESWDAFVAHFREEALGKLTESAMVMQVVPDADKIDVKFCVELGASIMLDKPIIAIVMPGVDVPAKLLSVADVVVQADLDTEEGQRQVHEALDHVIENIVKARDGD